MPSLFGRWLPLAHCSVIVVFIVLIYYPSLSVPFVFDDLSNIVSNPAVHPASASGLVDSFFHSEHSPSRPLAMLSFGVNYLFGGLHVFGYHLVNTIIHICNAVLLYMVVLQLLSVFNGQGRSYSVEQCRNVAFWSALFWAVNPVQTQAVTYIVQRMTSLAVLFYLVGILFYLFWLRGKTGAWLAALTVALSFVCGLACKEIVISLPIALLLIGLLSGRIEMKNFRQPVFLLAVLLFLLVLGWYGKGRSIDWFEQYSNRNFSPVERLMTQGRVLIHYISLYFYPAVDRLHLTYDILVSRSFFTPWTTLASFLAIAASLVGAVIVRKKLAVVSFAVLFFFLASGLEASFLNLELVFIHRLYLPSLFLVPGLIVLLPEGFFRRGSVLFFVVAAVLGMWTVERNVEWQNNEQMWLLEQQRGGGAGRGLNNQIVVAIDKGGFSQETASALSLALVDAKDKDRGSVLYNIAYGHYLAGDNEKSLATLRLLVDEYGYLYYSPYLVGKNLIALGRVDKAGEVAKELMLQDGDGYWQGVLVAAGVAIERDDFSGAEELLQSALVKADPSQVRVALQLRDELAKLYLQADRLEEAYQQYLQMIQLQPDLLLAWRQIHKMLVAGGDKENAEVVRLFLESKGVLVEKDMTQ